MSPGYVSVKDVDVVSEDLTANVLPEDVSACARLAESDLLN